MKKDLQANTKALRELCAKIDQNDELKNQISFLTAQLKTSCKEIWSLQRELALVRSSVKRRSNQSPVPSGDTQRPGVSDSAPSSEDSPVTTHANMVRSVDRLECSLTASERSLLNAANNLSPREPASSSPQAVNEGPQCRMYPGHRLPASRSVCFLEHYCSIFPVGSHQGKPIIYPPGNHRQVDNVTLQPAHRADPPVAPVHQPTPGIQPQVGAQTIMATIIEPTDQREQTTSPTTTRLNDVEALDW